MNDDIHEALGYIREARQWMQAEKSRQSAVRMRQEDWDFLIARLIEAEALLTHTEDDTDETSD